MLLGTHTGGRSEEYLQVVGVNIPTKPITVPPAPRPKVSLIKRIPHLYPGSVDKFSEANVARYNPSDLNCFASIANSGDVLLFDSLTAGAPIKPARALKFHSKAGSAMDWNTKEPGQLATGSEDATVAVWDVRTAVTGAVPKLSLPSAHCANVTSVKWSPHLPTVLASVSEDGTMVFSDTRSTDFAIPVIHVENAHHSYADDTLSSGRDSEAEAIGNGKKKDNGGSQDATNDDKVNEEKISEANSFAAINDVSFNPFNEYLLATASSDKTAALWDLRRMDRSLYSLVGHSAAVTTIQWSPHCECVLATGGYDRRVMMWDLSRINNAHDQSAESHNMDEDDDGPPELLFVHGGHTSKISQFEWHPDLPWVIASTSEDNIVQIWKPAAEIVNPQEHKEDDEENEDEEMDNAEDDENEKTL